MESSSSGYERRKLDGDELPSEYLAAKRREKLEKEIEEFFRKGGQVDVDNTTLDDTIEKLKEDFEFVDKLRKRKR